MDFCCVSIAVLVYLHARRHRTPGIIGPDARRAPAPSRHPPPPPVAPAGAAFVPSLCAVLEALPEGLFLEATRDAPTLVATAPSLRACVSQLARAPLLCVDVEHSPLSFVGFVCTLQLAAPGCGGFVIDTLVPEVRAALPDALRDMFLNEAMPKLLHGGANDVRWIARDFGLVLRGVLDTALLAAELREPRVGLAALLQKHCGASMTEGEKKRFQRLDWAARPLPADALAYAALDAAALPALAQRLFAAAGAVPAGRAAVARATARTEELLHLREDVAAAEAWRADSALQTALAALRSRATAAAGEAQEPPLVLEGARLSVAGALFCGAWLRGCAWRHARAVEGDKNPELGVCRASTLQAACWGALEAALASGRDAALAAALEALPLGPGAEGLAAAVCEGLPRDAAGAAAAAAAEVAHVRREVAAVAEAAARQDTLWGGTAAHGTSGGVGVFDGRREAAKAARAKNTFTPRATPLYDNTELLAPDGTVLARIDLSKARWYVEKGVAEVVGGAERLLGGDAGGRGAGEAGGPLLQIRMLRAPNGSGHAGDAFHLAPRINECVICGVAWGDDGLVRLYVVPREVRCHLPLAAKSYTNHDVVLSCVACHRRAGIQTNSLMRALSRELGVTLSRWGPAGPPPEGVQQRRVIKVCRAALGLLNHGAKLPLNKVDEMLAEVTNE
jgi:cation-transporting P-type ATPase D